MIFEFYVLNYNSNGRRVENFNIFRNIPLSSSTEREVKKYLRAPSKYEYKHYFMEDNPETLYGFKAFCKELDDLIKWQEWGRREYEISVSDAFEDNLDNLEKWDCYMQCHPNIEIIAHAVIRQYKEHLKLSKEEEIGLDN